MPDDARLRAAIERILGEQEPPFDSGPVSNPVDRFAHLPETTRQWLEELRKEDVDDLRRILQGFRKTGTVLWFFKWIIITVASGFVGTVAFGESVAKTLSWLKGGGG
jgi:hypothetical protein